MNDDDDAVFSEAVFRLVATVEDGDRVYPWRRSDVLFPAARLPSVPHENHSCRGSVYHPCDVSIR